MKYICKIFVRWRRSERDRRREQQAHKLAGRPFLGQETMPVLGSLPCCTSYRAATIGGFLLLVVPGFILFFFLASLPALVMSSAKPWIWGLNATNPVRVIPPAAVASIRSGWCRPRSSIYREVRQSGGPPRGPICLRQP